MSLPDVRAGGHDLACLTSMGVRLMPEVAMPVHAVNHFYLQATSAETNVLNVAASLGRSCLALTKFVGRSPVARIIKDQLRRRNIGYRGPEVEQGGPWGFRHQFNIADSGFGFRGPRVWNDRAGEVGCTLRAADFDLDQLFCQEGVSILHLSGLVAALSADTTECCLELVRQARSAGTLVSFDLNYRATFWQGREVELRDAFRRIASQAHILLGNEEDFQLCFGLEGDLPKAAGHEVHLKIENFKSLIQRVRRDFPQAEVFATSLRQVISAGQHLWGGILLADDRWFVEEPRPIQVLDRIGGGDGFAGGILYGILSGWEPEKWLQFGWAAGAMAAGSINDYAEPADESQLWDIYAGKARVQR